MFTGRSKARQARRRRHCVAVGARRHHRRAPRRRQPGRPRLGDSSMARRRGRPRAGPEPRTLGRRVLRYCAPTASLPPPAPAPGQLGTPGTRRNPRRTSSRDAPRSSRLRRVPTARALVPSGSPRVRWVVASSAAAAEVERSSGGGKLRMRRSTEPTAGSRVRSSQKPAGCSRSSLAAEWRFVPRPVILRPPGGKSAVPPNWPIIRNQLRPDGAVRAAGALARAFVTC